MDLRTNIIVDFPQRAPREGLARPQRDRAIAIAWPSEQIITVLGAVPLQLYTGTHSPLRHGRVEVCNRGLGKLLNVSHVSQLTRFSSTGFAGCARPSVHGTLRECGFRTDELGGRAEFQSARHKLDALQRTPCKTFGMVAQWCRRCPSMGWSRVAWQAVQRAWAPFIVDAFEATQERAFVHRTPTAAPLSQHVLCVRRV